MVAAGAMLAAVPLAPAQAFAPASQRVAAGQPHAQLIGDVCFGVAIGAPAPLAPATGVGWACSAVAARARRAAGDDAGCRIRISCVSGPSAE